LDFFLNWRVALGGVLAYRPPWPREAALMNHERVIAIELWARRVESSVVRPALHERKDALFGPGRSNLGLIIFSGTCIGAALLLILVCMFGPEQTGRDKCEVMVIGDNTEVNCR